MFLEALLVDDRITYDRGRISVKVLFISFGGYGDLLMGMSAFQDVRRHLPEAQIDWLTETETASILSIGKGIDRVHVCPLQSWRERKNRWSWKTARGMFHFIRSMARCEYDLILNVDDRLRTLLFVPFANTHRVAGFDKKQTADKLTTWLCTETYEVDPRHMLHRNREFCSKVLGYSLDSVPHIELDWDRVPQPTYDLPERAAIFIHGTTRDAKMWPGDRWIELGRALIQKDLVPVIPYHEPKQVADNERGTNSIRSVQGHPSEKAMAIRLHEAIPGSVLPPPTSILSFPRLLRQAELVVGIDTGMSHMASLLDVATVQIYADSPRSWTGPDWSLRQVSIGDKGSPPSVAEALDACLGCVDATSTVAAS